MRQAGRAPRRHAMVGSNLLMLHLNSRALFLRLDCSLSFPHSNHPPPSWCMSVASDIDECSTGEHNCVAGAICTNTDGSFTCACVYGTLSGGECYGAFIRHQVCVCVYACVCACLGVNVRVCPGLCKPCAHMQCPLTKIFPNRSFE